MNMFKKYQRGRRIYTAMDGKSEQVTVLPRRKNKEGRADARAEMPAEVGGGKTANLFMVYHSPDEFVVDFCLQIPGRDRAKVVERVVMSPSRAKQFVKALERSLK